MNLECLKDYHAHCSIKTTFGEIFCMWGVMENCFVMEEDRVKCRKIQIGKQRIRITYEKSGTRGNWDIYKEKRFMV